MTKILVNGTRSSNMDELLDWVLAYPIQWREPKLNLAELARLRWIEGWSRRRLAEHFKKSDSAIQFHLQKLKRARFLGVGLTVDEIGRIRQAIC